MIVFANSGTLAFQFFNVSIFGLLLFGKFRLLFMPFKYARKLWETLLIVIELLQLF